MLRAPRISLLREREALTFAECAQVWGHSPSFFRGLFRRGDIAGYSVSGGAKPRVKLYADSVRAYFRRHEAAPEVAPKMTARERANASPRVQAVREARSAAL